MSDMNVPLVTHRCTCGDIGIYERTFCFRLSWLPAVDRPTHSRHAQSFNRICQVAPCT